MKGDFTIMTVKAIRADGVVEIFETTNYQVSKREDLHPALLKVIVYNGNKKIASVKRKHALFYKLFKFNTKEVQDKIIEINARMAVEAQQGK